MVPVGRSRGAPSQLDAAALYQHALRALSRRPHAFAELEAKLLRRCARPSDVSAVCRRLVRSGFLNDRHVAESHAALRRDQALLGPSRVVAELRRRGIDEPLAEQAVAKAYRETDEGQLARLFLRKRISQRPGGRRVDRPKEIMRLYRALARAGFEPSTISDALREVSSNDEVLDRLSEEATAAG